MQRKIRVLVGKPGLDGHDRGAKVVAAALRDAGMEVIYTGLHQSAEQIVEAAIQEDVDVVALSILSGAHMTLFPEVLRLMRERGVGDKLLSGGGIIPPDDIESLSRIGVGRLFGPGASTQDVVHYLRGWFSERHGADALAPLPVPPAPRVMSAEAWSAVATTKAAHSMGERAAPRKPARKPAPKKAKPAAKKPAPKKPARKAVKVAKKAARKSAKKSAMKQARKPAKTAKKPARKPAKAAKKLARRSASSPGARGSKRRARSR